jgi:hypothetical protein
MKDPSLGGSVARSVVLGQDTDIHLKITSDKELTAHDC